jgi:hypothetical protein
MAVEEISLTLPEDWPASDERPPWTAGGDDAGRGEPGAAALAQSFVQAARKRDGFVFTRRQRARRIEQYERSVKSIVKQAASEACSMVADRHVRMVVRTRIYGTLMALMREIASDQLALRTRTRRIARWSLAIAAMGLVVTTAALYISGTLPIRH